MKKEKNIKEKVIIMDYLHDLMMNKGIKNAIINVDENVVYINHDNYGNTNYGCLKFNNPKEAYNIAVKLGDNYRKPYYLGKWEKCPEKPELKIDLRIFDLKYFYLWLLLSLFPKQFNYN